MKNEINKNSILLKVLITDVSATLIYVTKSLSSCLYIYLNLSQFNIFCRLRWSFNCIKFTSKAKACGLLKFSIVYKTSLELLRPYDKLKYS